MGHIFYLCTVPKKCAKKAPGSISKVYRFKLRTRYTTMFGFVPRQLSRTTQVTSLYPCSNSWTSTADNLLEVVNADSSHCD